MNDNIQFVKCTKCGHEQADMGNDATCEGCGLGPMPTADCLYKEIKLVFEDWKRGGMSVYQTEEGASLSFGVFHSGTTFNAKIKLNEPELDELKDALSKGYEPIFRIGFIPTGG
jgi:hypothetical protein